MNRFASHAIAVVIGGAIVAAGSAWLKLRPSPPSVIAQPAKELKHEKTATLTCKPIVIYRDRVKSELGLPDNVVRDGSQEVVAASRIPGNEFPHTVTATFNQSTGSVTQYVRQDPLPWMAYTGRWSIGAYYGANDEQASVYRITSGYSLLKIKRMDIGAAASIESGGRWFTGIGGEIRF